jgi:Cu2+-exporting ATPase
VLARGGKALAYFELADETRPEAAALVDTLQRGGRRVELLTGDPSAQGPRLAETLGMDSVHHGYSPARKLEYIQELQARGQRVAMVGDGLNDAPVLAAADCSFAVNQATDLAKSSADVILLNPSLDGLSRAFDSARRCRRIVRQNIGWALGYNLLAIPIAAAGMVPPWAAAIGMSASSLLVVLNSLRLK